jgi:AraC-like DNA-binding protein
MLNERMYAPYKIAALVETLGDQGISAEESLMSSGINSADIYNPETRTSVRQYLAVCKNAVQLSRDPATPFYVGMKMHLSAYGMYGYALICSLTIRDFFNLGVKYHRLATPTLSIQWREEPQSAVWWFPEDFISAPSKELRQFLIEQQLAQHVTHLRDVVSRECVPQKVHVSYPAPPHAKLYEEFLCCPVYFDQPESELYYDASILDRKPQLAHRLTSTLLQETCDRLIGQAKTSVGVAGEVYQILMQTPGYFPDMDEVADALNMTSRTLRRKLDAETISFAEISNDVRRSLATEYLQTTKLSTEDIATLLGFSDAASFRHAFKKWTGKAPSAYR